MTAEERMKAVIRLQVPDRVPVVPCVYYYFATYSGIDYADLFDPRLYRRATMKLFDELGPWDAYNFFHTYYRELVSFFMPMVTLEPGFELPADSIRQFKEEEVMREEDYDRILEICEKTPGLSFYRVMLGFMPRIYDHIREGWRSYAFVLSRFAAQLVYYRYEFRDWISRGATLFYSTGPVEVPFDTFSLARGLIPFARDLRNRPEDIMRAADALVPGYLFLIKAAVNLFGIKRVMIDLHRSSSDFISPAQFRKYALPSLKLLVDGLHDEGIAVIMHCDGNWDLNLEALRELPAGHCVMQLDGATDIFKAKEVIGDRICIYGDVPASMLALGSPAEVDEYCHRLIEEVGKGGGFILGSGCEVAPNARPENVKTMIASVVKYGYYGK
jgi:Uroporphyrinogen decarboxylase (URO-D)